MLLMLLTLGNAGFA